MRHRPRRTTREKLPWVGGLTFRRPVVEVDLLDVKMSQDY